MPVLSDAKRERYAQAIVSGKSKGDAVIYAGFSKKHASRAAHQIETQAVVDRIAELLGAAAKQVVIERKWVLEALIENCEIALGRRQVEIQVDNAKYKAPRKTKVTMRDAGAANKALELLGREAGLFVETRRNINEHSELSEADLDRRIAEKLTFLGDEAGSLARIGLALSGAPSKDRTH